MIGLGQSQGLSQDVTHDIEVGVRLRPVDAEGAPMKDLHVNPTEYARIIRRRLYTDQALNYGRAKK